ERNAATRVDQNSTCVTPIKIKRDLNTSGADPSPAAQDDTPPGSPSQKKIVHSLLRRALQHSHLPPVFGAGHYHVVVNLSAVRMNDRVSVKDFRIQRGLVVKLHGGAVERIEDGLNFVAAIHQACSQTGALLVVQALDQFVQSEADEVVVECARV